MCGICLILPTGNVEPCNRPIRLCVSLLQRLQHRGRQMTKIVSDTHEYGGSGTVDKVYQNEEILQQLKGKFCIGHTRYTTSRPTFGPGNTLIQCQPFIIHTPFSERLIIAHNGQLGGMPENYTKVINFLEKQNYTFRFGTDSEIFIAYYCLSKKTTPKERIMDAFEKVSGSATIVGVIISGPSCYYFGGRNNGNRPLFTGTFIENGVKYKIFSSEDYMFEDSNILNKKEIAAGTVVWYDASTQEESTVHLNSYNGNPRHCIFELFYFSHPLTTFYGKRISSIRKRFGHALFKEHPLKADVVISVPDSGNHCALGYSEASGIPFDFGILRNHFIGRSFIGENNDDRLEKARYKYMVDSEVVKDKFVVVVDDSLVRSITCSVLVKQLKKAGAKQIAFLLASPPIRHPNYYGIDIQTQSELAAHNISIKELETKLDLNYLGYLSLQDALNEIYECTNIQKDNLQFCTSCFTGDFW